MITDLHQQYFREHGFVIVDQFVPDTLRLAATDRFDALFSGDFETGVQPDEWNWRAGVSSADHTRQICNGWKADRAIARLVLSEAVGRCCAELMNWSGARINQDNLIWKPPGAKPLGFHQDDAYQDWIVPSSMVTCWMAMDDTSAEGGTIEYVPGSHRWPVGDKSGQFHAPDDYHEALKIAAEGLGVNSYDIAKLAVKAGDAVFHHGATWHGSGTNLSDKPRRSVVSHCMSSEARFHESNTSPIYSRYKRAGTTEMDDSFFPVLWTRDGGRSLFLESYLAA